MGRGYRTEGGRADGREIGEIVNVANCAQPCDWAGINREHWFGGAAGWLVCSSMWRSAERGSEPILTRLSMTEIRISRDSQPITRAPSSAWFASGWPSQGPGSPVCTLISARLPFVSRVLPFETSAGFFIWPRARPRPRANRQARCDGTLRLCSAGTFRKNTGLKARTKQQRTLTFGA